MICSNCGDRFRLGGGGHGFSDAPGLFLIAGSIGVFVFMIGWGMKDRGYPTIGLLMACFGGALAVYGLGAIRVAMYDANLFGPCRCPNCNNVVKVYPWSF